MDRVSDNFQRHEFACPCGCGFAAVDVELLGVLERLRTLYAKPVVVSSGCRCEKRNRTVLGAQNSYHVRGMAADIRIPDEHPEEIAALLDDMYPDRYGIGTYSAWVHFDVRPGSPARWRE